MAIKRVRWVPDTHPNCVFEYWHDTESSDDPWNHCTLAVVDGVEQADPVAVYQTVLDENRLKNRAEAMLYSLLPERMLKPELDSDGDPTGKMVVKDKHRPVWEFGAPDGLVAFEVPDITLDEAQPIRLALAAEFGPVVTLRSGNG